MHFLQGIGSQQNRFDFTTTKEIIKLNVMHCFPKGFVIFKLYSSNLLLNLRIYCSFSDSKWCYIANGFWFIYHQSKINRVKTFELSICLCSAVDKVIGNVDSRRFKCINNNNNNK